MDPEREKFLKSLPHSKNVTAEHPSKWIGAYLVPCGIKKGGCNSATFVYLDDVKEKNVNVYFPGESEIFNWDPERLNIYIDNSRIIQSYSYH
jgi:hypothetical protein